MRRILFSLPILCVLLAGVGCMGDLQWAHPSLFGGENQGTQGDRPRG